MRDVCFIADVAVLPRWMRVTQALDYRRRACIRASTAPRPRPSSRRPRSSARSKVRELSKGMVTQLHLALVMAIDARLLVLDEPTLGLDILYRKQFYDTLLNDYFDRTRTIVVTTHQVEEIQHILTDVMFIDRGRIVLDCTMEDFERRYAEVMALSGAGRSRAGALPDPRAAGVRPQHLPLRRRRARQARRARRSPHAEHRRPLRRGDGTRGGRRDREGRMSELPDGGTSVPQPPGETRAPAGIASSPTRPLYWSVRRELWESRSIYLAPLVAAGVVLIGFLISIAAAPGRSPRAPRWIRRPGPQRYPSATTWPRSR